MKKLLASIVIVTYLVMSSGVVVNFHYCMNRLASTKLFAKGTKVCALCGMKMHKNNGCCHDDVKVVKLQTDHNKAQLSFPVQAPDPIVAIPASFNTIGIVIGERTTHFLNHSPPLLSYQDTYLQNCVFRI